MILLDDDTDSDSEEEITIKVIVSKLDDLTISNNLVNNHGGALQKAISDYVERKDYRITGEKKTKENKDMSEQSLKLINEKAQLFRITSNAMMTVS